jgi:predicted enzyme related to lactoylglutathione lyase
MKMAKAVAKIKRVTSTSKASVSKKAAKPKKAAVAKDSCEKVAASPHVDGALCYFEIPSPDVNKAAKFYSKVFGWQVEVSKEMGNYGMFCFKDGSGGGGLDPSAKVSGELGINLVLKTDDIPAKLAQIKAAGGTIVKAKEALPGNYGYVGYFKDPNGNLLCIWSKS